MIFIDTQLLQFFLPNIKNHASPSWKIKGQTDFTSVLFMLVHSPIYSRCFYIIHTLLLNVYRRTNPYIYKKKFIVLYLLQCWHYLKYFLMFQNGLLDHLVLYLNNKILPIYFSRDYFSFAKKMSYVVSLRNII